MGRSIGRTERGWRRYALPAIVVLLLAPLAHGEDSAAIETNGEYLVLTPHVRWVVEEGEALTPQAAAEVLGERPAYGGESEWLELGFMNAVVWLAIPMRNHSREQEFVLEFRNPRMSLVDLYVPNGSGAYTVIPNGVVRPFHERPFQHPMPAFPLTLAPGDSTTVLLRLENVGDFRQRVRLYDTAAFANHVATANNPTMISAGVLLALALYHLLISVSLREKGYFFLSLFIFAWMMFFLAATGAGKMLIWGDFPWLDERANSIFNCFMNATFIIFAMAFLESKQYTPRMFRAGLVFCAVWLLQFVHVGVSESLFRIDLGRDLVLATLGFVVLLVVQAIRNGSPRAWFFVFSWVFMVVGGGLLLLLSWYVVSVQWILGTPLINILFTMSILLWSFELTGRIKVREREQRALLEKQVKERTQELERALGDVKTLSGLLPICSSCKKIRDDSGYWSGVETYLSEHTDAGFTHGICPECVDSLYPEYAERRKAREEKKTA